MSVTLPETLSPGSGLVVLGRTEPRLFTPPLVTGPPGPCGCGCALTPETSFGFDVDEFATEVLAHPLDPWQRWVVIHAGELLPDGRPRFRHLIILVSRQNGKTEIPVVLSLFWQWVCDVPMILGTSTKIDYAKESWMKAVQLAEKAPGLEVPKRREWTRQANGEQESWNGGCRYKIAASNAEGGRSLTVHRLILDELRQHHDYSAWGAAVPAGNAVTDFQAWALSNAGDDRSVVLNDKREAALKYITEGVGDPRLGLFEWSAPDGANPLDEDALAQANPNYGRRIDPDALLGEALTAVEKGGEALATFRTECMCQRVKLLDPAIDPDQWTACLDVGTLDDCRSRLALMVDVSPDGLHATLAAAGRLADDRVRVELLASWDGAGCTQELRAALPGWLTKVRPVVLGWLPGGPAAAMAADLKKRPGWPPPGVRVEEITTENAAVCMGFAEQVGAGQVAHSDDPLLNAHVAGAERLRTGDRWVFSRKGGVGHCDAAYAAAGAVHLARTLPAAVGRPRVITARRSTSVLASRDMT